MRKGFGLKGLAVGPGFFMAVKRAGAQTTRSVVPPFLRCPAHLKGHVQNRGANDSLSKGPADTAISAVEASHTGCRIESGMTAMQ